MRLLNCILVLYTLGLLVSDVQGHGNKMMDDETYDVIIKALRGEFHIPVKERTRIQRSALVRLWRNKHLFRLSDDNKSLLCNGKLVVKKSCLKGIVKTGLEDTKGCGARKLNVYLSDQYCGISTRNVQKVLDRSRCYHLHRATFRNKAIPKPIMAKTVQDCHQIDLLDMGKWAVKLRNVRYKYILTVLDVCSRYVWLRPLRSKESKEVAKHLAEIYTEHGPAKILQHDQGKEFKGAVKKLMESYHVKVIQSSPYHPQSQGKVERTHRVLRRKIMYDFVNFKQGGVNWVAHMPAYAKVMNLDKKEVLNWMSPFVYYGRKNNSKTHALSNNAGDASPDSVSEDFEENMAEFEEKRRKIRRQALKATERCMKRLTKLRVNLPSSVYNVQDRVLVRVSKGPRFSKRYAVVPGIVLQRNADLSKVKIQIPGSPNHQDIKWFSVCDLTSATREQEKQRFKHKAKKHLHTKLLQPITHEMRLESFETLGFRTRLDPDPDGSCQFAAMADQLAKLGIMTL